MIQGTWVLLLRTVHYIYCVAVSSKFLYRSRSIVRPLIVISLYLPGFNS